MAIEATQRYHDRTTTAMARYIAKQAVIAELRRQGRKIQHYSAKELYELADDYFRSHCEEVMREVMVWQVERELSRLSTMMNRARNVENAGVSLCKCHARKGAQK